MNSADYWMRLPADAHNGHRNRKKGKRREEAASGMKRDERESREACPTSL